MCRYYFPVAALAFLLVTGALAQQFGAIQSYGPWSASYTAGSTVSGVFLGGTGIRHLIPFNGKLYAGNEYTNDTPGPEGVQNGQILELDCPVKLGCTWKQSAVFSGSTYCPAGNLNCDQAIADLQVLTFQFNASKAPVSAAVGTVLSASIWYQGSITGTACSAGQVPEYFYDLNNIDGLWYQVLADCPTTSLLVGARAFGSHIDQVIDSPSQDVDYVFAGVEGDGIETGQLNPSIGAGTNNVIWNAGNPEYLTSTYLPATGLGSCSGGTAQVRAMSFAEATGTDGVKREYASVCFEIFVRIDGPQNACGATQVDSAPLGGSGCVNRWQEYWVSPTPGATSNSGLRGMTTDPNTGANLLVGAEGSIVDVYNVPAAPACGTIIHGTVSMTIPTCATLELNLITQNTTDWGFGASNAIAPYNFFTFVPNGAGGWNAYMGLKSNVAAGAPNTPPAGYDWLWTVGAIRQMSNSYYYVRTPSAVWTQYAMPPGLFGTPTQGIRTIALSPFASEPTALYFGGIDEDLGATYCWTRNTAPATCSGGGVDPGLLHNNGWIARMGP